jgi:hypothetical protein
VEKKTRSYFFASPCVRPYVRPRLSLHPRQSALHPHLPVPPSPPHCNPQYLIPTPPPPYLLSPRRRGTPLVLSSPRDVFAACPFPFLALPLIRFLRPCFSSEIPSPLPTPSASTVLWEEVARKLSPALARRWSASNVAEVDTALLPPPT